MEEKAAAGEGDQTDENFRAAHDAIFFIQQLAMDTVHICSVIEEPLTTAEARSSHVQRQRGRRGGSDSAAGDRHQAHLGDVVSHVAAVLGLVDSPTYTPDQEGPEVMSFRNQLHEAVMSLHASLRHCRSAQVTYNANEALGERLLEAVAAVGKWRAFD